MQKQNKSFLSKKLVWLKSNCHQNGDLNLLNGQKVRKIRQILREVEGQYRNKNNEYYLIIEDEKDEKQSVRMNISDLKQPMNKCNLLIPSPPYNEPRDIQNIHCLPYKAKAKIENNQKMLKNCKINFVALNIVINRNRNIKIILAVQKLNKVLAKMNFQDFKFLFSSNSLIQVFNYFNSEIRESQQGKQNQPAEAYDKSNLRSNLIDFLRTKGDNGANIQEIKQYYKFQSVPEKHLRDSLKLFAKTTMRANKLIYILPSTLQN